MSLAHLAHGVRTTQPGLALSGNQIPGSTCTPPDHETALRVVTLPVGAVVPTKGALASCCAAFRAGDVGIWLTAGRDLTIRGQL